MTKIGMSLNNTFCPKNQKIAKKGLTIVSASGILKVQSRNGHQTGQTAKSDSRRLRPDLIVLDNTNATVTIDHIRQAVARWTVAPVFKKKSLKNRRNPLTKADQCDRIGAARKGQPVLSWAK